MRIQTCSVELKATLGRDYPKYKITGYVKNGRAELFIDDDKDEQVGIVGGELGPTGNFAVTICLHNSKYEKISVGATVKEDIIEHGGVSINDEAIPCDLDGIVSEEVYAVLTILNKEGLHRIEVEGEMKYEKND